MTATAAGRSAEPSRPRLPWFLLGLSVVLVGAMVTLSTVATVQPAHVRLWLRPPAVRR